MRAYSPPVTRQRARAIILGEAAQKDQRGKHEQEQRGQAQAQTQRAQGNRGTARSRRDHPQQRGSPEERRLSDHHRGDGAEKEIKGGGSGAGGYLTRSREAVTRPKPAATLGNSVSRWRRGGGRKNPGVGEQGGKSGAGGGSRSKVAVAVAASGPGQHAGEESTRGGGAGADAGVAPSSAAVSSSPLVGDAAASKGEATAPAPAAVPSVACSQPLEEVNPSILNAKGFLPGGGSGSGSVSYASGSGKEEGRTLPPPATTAAAASSSSDTPPPQREEPDGGNGDDGGLSVTGGSDSLQAAAEGNMTSGEGAEPAGAAGASEVPDPSSVMSDGQAGGGAVGVDGGSGDGAGALPTPPPARGGSAADPSSGAGWAVIDCGGGAGASSASSAAAAPATGGIMAESPAREVKPPAAGGWVGGALEGPGSRLKGKSVEAKGSTGVSPMQKRNRRELKLSEEETAMAGAPQGPVYQVAVLETGEFEPSPNADEEMRAVLAASGGGGDWADLYSAVDSARRLCIFHSEVVVHGGETTGEAHGEGDGEVSSNLAGVVGLLTLAVGNLRSSMVRNALLGVGDIFSFLKHDVGRVDIHPMVAGTLQRLAGDKRFICQTAAQAMEAAARNGPSLSVLHAILPSLDDRNAEVAAKSAFYSEQCLATLGVGSKAGVGLPEGMEFDRLVPGMSRALNGKVAEGRASSRRALLRSRKAMGLGAFEAAVAAALEKSEASALLAALATPNRTGGASRGGLGGREPILHGRGGAARGAGVGAGAGGRRGARPSIREQMMAARRKKEEEAGARAGEREGGGAGDGFVVVT
eukprot:g6946.t1